MNKPLFDESRTMHSALYPQILKELEQAKQERDLYKDRYGYLAKFCNIEGIDWDANRCELNAHWLTFVRKNCKTVDEAVDFVLGGNGV